jgi:hypothetical protein
VAKAWLEVVGPPNERKQVVHLGLRDLANRSALLAVEVIVRAVGEMIDRSSVPKVDMDDHTSAFKSIQRAVDGG